jgi:GxxExxY protein
MADSSELDRIAKIIVDAAICVHRSLGPGLLESAYQKCLAFELNKRGLKVDCEVLLPIVYDGQNINSGYRVDMIVENLIIIENKTVDALLPVYKSQLYTYLKLSDRNLGLLLNWNVKLMKDGIKRVVHNFKDYGKYKP